MSITKYPNIMDIYRQAVSYSRVEGLSDEP